MSVNDLTRRNLKFLVKFEEMDKWNKEANYLDIYDHEMQATKNM